jgi:hypothetical protein
MFYFLNLLSLFTAGVFFETAYAVMNFFHSMGIYI